MPIFAADALTHTTAMTNGKLLWVDDEIEMLHPHILFLEKKNYEVVTASNGPDAVDLCRSQDFDLILLDENMPGLSGLETLALIKECRPAVPVVMVTKSEEEDIMDQAIGSKIADYLIKPVNPNQILLTLKKNIHRQEIVTEATVSGYRQDFARIDMLLSTAHSADEWVDLYKRLVYWELELSETGDEPMREMLQTQKEEANRAFARFIKSNYSAWTTAQPGDRPLISPDVFRRKVFPLLDEGRKVFVLVLDNFRLDQWRLLARELADDFAIEEDVYYSILPTATQYARNALFSGLMPAQIRKLYPHLWVDEEEDEGKNLNEEQLIAEQLKRFRRREAFTYNKVNDGTATEKLLAQADRLGHTPLNVLVVNFIDILSHARTESKAVRELANDEAAFRSITLSWFRHSPVRDLFRTLAMSDYDDIIVTTDHGSIRVDTPSKVVGDRNVNTNLRYKLGRNLSYNDKEVYAARRPDEVQLPAPNLSTAYIFATGRRFFAYPNNYNYYVGYYKGTFQHGGVSLEEMIVPLITLRPRKR